MLSRRPAALFAVLDKDGYLVGQYTTRGGAVRAATQRVSHGKSAEAPYAVVALDRPGGSPKIWLAYVYRSGTVERTGYWRTSK